MQSDSFLKYYLLLVDNAIDSNLTFINYDVCNIETAVVTKILPVPSMELHSKFLQIKITGYAACRNLIQNINDQIYIAST